MQRLPGMVEDHSFLFILFPLLSIVREGYLKILEKSQIRNSRDRFLNVIRFWNVILIN